MKNENSCVRVGDPVETLTVGGEGWDEALLRSYAALTSGTDRLCEVFGCSLRPRTQKQELIAFIYVQISLGTSQQLMWKFNPNNGGL
jgi:hypothetical protein